MLTASDTMKRNKLGDIQNTVDEVWAVVRIYEEFKKSAMASYLKICFHCFCVSYKNDLPRQILGTIMLPTFESFNCLGKFWKRAIVAKFFMKPHISGG
jgi:hypothetical protein